MKQPPPRSTLFPYTTLFRSMILTGFVHDLGKILCLWGEPQWAVVGDTFPTGCAYSRNLWERCRQPRPTRSEEHTSELQSRRDLVCRLLLEKTNYEQNGTTAN